MDDSCLDFHILFTHEGQQPVKAQVSAVLSLLWCSIPIKVFISWTKVISLFSMVKLIPTSCS